MEQQIQNLQDQINELKALVVKNNFSNLYIFDTPVQFRREINFKLAPAAQKLFYFPTDNTDPTSGGGAATGRIPIDIAGATKYLPYY